MTGSLAAKGRGWRPVPSLLRLALVLAALPALPTASAGQFLERPWLSWQTVRAGRFSIHFPAELATWARFVARRMPAVDSAVTELVGHSPRARVEVVIEDPYAVANGVAFTEIERPVIVFWAFPPDAREVVGQFRSWPELLAVHEFAHVAHLTRPSRNPLTRSLWRLAPLDLGPIALRAPRWVIEGYATYVEGALTGSGRPFGFWRPAMLRQWAIEGRLPTYQQLSGWSDFEGGHFAYLAGSAFLEWLARRPGNGDSTFVHVWRRLTARVNRGFDEAFAGVYGEGPASLYGRFTAELTAQSMEAERELRREGVVEGEMVQRMTWSAGDPAPSPDGSRVALVVRSKTRPSRVVVWRTATEPDTLAQRIRERILRRDPEDVPARRIYPPPKRPVATLLARGGRSFENPRWFADGKRVLLSRPRRLADGALRSDLFIWSVGARAVRRVTRSAGVHDADPAPDGQRAVALRCQTGHCNVVAVDLESGVVRVLAAGDTITSFSHPRYSPDGRTVAVAMHRDDRWRIVLLDGTGGLRVADPDDGANRFDPCWLGPSTLVVSSDRLGTANLERIDLPAGGAPRVRALTRVMGAAFAPAVNPADSSIWFLSLHSHGFDVRRLAPTTASPDLARSPLLDPRLVPAVPRQPPTLRDFPPREIPESRSYRLGSRGTHWLPTGAIGADGRAAGIALLNGDVVGRLNVLAQGALGNGGAWRGAALDAAWRGLRPELRASVFVATQGVALAAIPVAAREVEMRGARLRADYTHAFDLADVRVGGGVSHMRIDDAFSNVAPGARSVAFGELSGTARQTRDGASASETLTLHGSLGRTDAGGRFERTMASLVLRSGGDRMLPAELSAVYGRVSPSASAFERFLIGGLPSTLVDGSLLTQRLAMPALPLGVAIGERAVSVRAATTLGLLTPYYWAASARDGAGRFDRWHRVAGLELAIDERALFVLGTPGARATAGIARSLDAPFARRTRGYVTIVLRP